uniref:Fatty acid hydroxylase domain-containing protein n=1 Tax=Chlamydomonas euryale TaxID=1486919 RepID=A0A7R9VB25_9CHLO|mmetsp:Transcript_26282/g.78056  ORF Transcript_26282/g.78056 Transcript_26282/m.78056 type:complete len:247 (+) Transcript_26282:295-1035(+)
MAGLVDNIGKLLHWSFVEKFPPGSPEFGLLVTPLLVYWALAVFYDVLDHLDLPITRRFKVVRKVRGRENIPSKRQVVTRVLVQQLAQFVVAYVAMVLDCDQCAKRTAGNVAQTALQFLFGMLVMDTWQFWIHRTMHVYPVLYKHIHSHHHQLLIPYAWGALYNHPLEGLLLDTLGGLVTLYGGMMSCQAGAWLINFATAKTVLDHCGYVFPVNPLHGLFPNGAAYHDIHHDIKVRASEHQSAARRL